MNDLYFIETQNIEHAVLCCNNTSAGISSWRIDRTRKDWEQLRRAIHARMTFESAPLDSYVVIDLTATWTTIKIYVDNDPNNVVGSARFRIEDFQRAVDDLLKLHDYFSSSDSDDPDYEPPSLSPRETTVEHAGEVPDHLLVPLSDQDGDVTMAA